MLQRQQAACRAYSIFCLALCRKCLTVSHIIQHFRYPQNHSTVEIGKNTVWAPWANQGRNPYSATVGCCSSPTSHPGRGRSERSPAASTPPRGIPQLHCQIAMVPVVVSSFIWGDYYFGLEVIYRNLLLPLLLYRSTYICNSTTLCIVVEREVLHRHLATIQSSIHLIIQNIF